MNYFQSILDYSIDKIKLTCDVRINFLFFTRLIGRSIRVRLYGIKVVKVQNMVIFRRIVHAVLALFYRHTILK